MDDFILYLCNCLGVIIPLTLALMPGKMFPAETVWQKNPWSISSNFWQIILTEYFVQIYNTFEPWKGWSHQYEYSPKVTTFQNTIISQCCGNLFFLTDFLCMSGSWGHQWDLQPGPASPRASPIPDHNPGVHFIQARATSPCSCLAVDLAECDPYSQANAPSQPQPFPVPRELPTPGATWLPVWLLGWGLAARSCPATPGNLCTLWSCQPMQCHDNSNAKT